MLKKYFNYLFSGWEVADSCIDIPDKRDYPFHEYINWYAEWGEKKWPYKKITTFNQWGVPACTRYGVTHINNAQNILEYEKHWKIYKQINPLTIWEKGNKIKSLQAAMWVMMKEGLIEWFTRVKSISKTKQIQEIKQAIDIGKWIYTWSPRGDWAYIKRTGMYRNRPDNKFVWHAFCMVDYDDNRKVFRCMNSYGPSWGIGKGYFVVRYDDIHLLYNKYPIIDKDDTGKFKKFKSLQYAKVYVKLAKKLWDVETEMEYKKALGEWASAMRKSYEFTDKDL